MFTQTLKAALAATRLLFKSWVTLLLLVAIYAGLLTAAYLFVSTREATLTQLALTLALMVIVPALFFALQAVTVNYPSGARPRVLIKKAALDCLRLIVVTVPLLLLAAAVVYGLDKIDSQLVITTAARYLLAVVIVPLLAIQLWLAVSRDGLRTLWRRLHKVIGNAFAPQSVLVYATGLLIFAATPYLLVFQTTQTGRAWLEVSLLGFRLLASALLILIGWVMTVGTLSMLHRQ